MATPRETAVEKVQDVIEAQIPSWYGPGSRLLPDVAVEKHAWSTHFLARVSGFDREVELVVKIPLWDQAPDLATALAAGPQEPTRDEYQALCRVEAMVAASGDPGLAAVGTVAYVEEINAIVTERLECSPLRRVRGRSVIEAGRALGRWLRRFHDEIGGAAEREFTFSLVAEECEGLVRRALGKSRSLQDAVAGIRVQAESLAGAKVRVAITHGDLGPSNVLVTPDGRVAVIDPNLVQAPVEADLAKLAAALRTPRHRLLGGSALGRRHHPVEAAVLEGYGAVSQDVYALCRRIAAASRWLDVEESGAGGLRRLALPMARRVFAAEVASGGTTA